MEFFQDPCNLSGNSNKAPNIVFGLKDQKNHPQEISIASVRRVWIFSELHNFETCHLNVHVAEAEWSSRTNPLLFHPKHELKVIFYIFAVVKMISPLKYTFFQYTANTWNSAFPVYFFNYILSSIAFSLSAFFFLNSLLSGLFSGFRQAFNFCSKLFICSLLAVDFVWPLTKVAMFSIWLRTCC